MLGFELYSQLCRPLYGGQEESAVSVSVNQPGSQQLPLTLLRVLLCYKKKCSMKHKVPSLFLEMFLQCLTHPQKHDSLRAPPCSGEPGQRQLWQLHLPKHVPASLLFPSSGAEEAPCCHPAALPLQQPLWNDCHSPTCRGCRGFLLEETKVNAANLHLR